MTAGFGRGLYLGTPLLFPKFKNGFLYFLEDVSDISYSVERLLYFYLSSQALLKSSII